MKKTCLILLICSLLFTISWTPTVNITLAATGSEVKRESLELGSSIGALEEDKPRGYIYATAYASNELLFINTETFQVEKRLAIGGKPRGMDQYKDQLYVALSDSNQIVVVDLETQSIESTIPTSDKPKNLVVTEGLIYYSTNSSWSTIYQLNLLTNASIKVLSSVYEPLLALDAENDRLYIGEIGVSRHLLYTLELSTGTKLLELNPSSVSYASSLFLDEDFIYYGNLKVRKSSGTVVSSIGPFRAEIDQYVLVNSKILTKDEEIPLLTLDYIFNGFYILSEPTTLYHLMEHGTTLYKIVFDLPSIPIPFDHIQANNKLAFSNAITSFVIGADEKYLYGVSKSTHRLIQIDLETFEVVNERYIGSQPTSIDIASGVIYVSLEGSSYIVKLDTNFETDFMAPIEEIEVGDLVNQLVATSDGILYYLRGYVHTNLYQFDGEHKKLGGRSYSGGSPPVLSEDELYLYVQENESKLVKMSVKDYSVVEGIISERNHAYHSIIIDGQFLYIDAKRYNSEKLSFTFGPYTNGNYAASLLHAKDEHIIAKNGVYHPDSTNPVFTFPFTATYSHILKDGRILLSASYDSKRPYSHELFIFDNMTHMKKTIESGFLIQDAFFEETSSNKYNTSGVLLFIPGDSAEHISYYMVQFYDKNNKNTQSNHIVISSVFVDTPIPHYYVDISFPNNTEKIVITPYPSHVENNELLKEISYELRLWKNNEYYVDKLTFSDTDISQETIGGMLSFDKARAELKGDRYAIYFVGEDAVIGEPIGYVVGTDQKSYKFQLPSGTILPVDAIMLAVHLQDENGKYGAPDFTLVEIEKRMTIAPKLEQITVKNSSGANDSVTVKGLQSKDVVKVYSLDLELIGSKTVANNESSVTIGSLKLDNKYPAILVSVTTAPKHESLYVYVMYDIEESSAGPIIPFPFPGDIGDGLLGAPVKETFKLEENLKEGIIAGEIEQTLTGDGIRSLKLQLSIESLNRLLSSAYQSSQIIIPYHSEFRSLELELTHNQGQALLNTSYPVKLHVQGKHVTFSVPKEAFKQYQASGQKSNYKLNITEIVNQEAVMKMNKKLEANGFSKAITSYSFLINRILDKAILPFNYDISEPFMQVQFIFDATGHSIDSLVAASYNPQDESVQSVPATFKQNGNIITATLYTKSLGQFVITSREISFNDVDNNHFSSKAINELARRAIINGYQDQSFKPEAFVTRAEATAMLTRALGIVTSQYNAGFIDVAADAWYDRSVSTAVNAGLFKGYPNGSFKPNQRITQQEMVSIIYQALQYGGYVPSADGNLRTFDTEAGYAAWSQQAVDGLLKENIMRASDVFDIKASKTATRGEFAEMLYRMLRSLNLI